MDAIDLIKWEDVNSSGIVGLDDTLKSAYCHKFNIYLV